MFFSLTFDRAQLDVSRAIPDDVSRQMRQSNVDEFRDQVIVTPNGYQPTCGNHCIAAVKLRSRHETPDVWADCSML